MKLPGHPKGAPGSPSELAVESQRALRHRKIILKASKLVHAIINAPKNHCYGVYMFTHLAQSRSSIKFQFLHCGIRKLHAVIHAAENLVYPAFVCRAHGYRLRAYSLCLCPQPQDRPRRDARSENNSYISCIGFRSSSFVCTFWTSN